MPTVKKAPPLHLWWVRHPVCGLAIVNASNWELANVEAAAWWKYLGKLLPRSASANGKNRAAAWSACCGTIFNGDGFRCAKCEIIERDKKLNKRARERQYYRSMMPAPKSTG